MVCQESRLHVQHVKPDSGAKLTLREAFEMNRPPILRLGTLKDVARFQEHVHVLGLNIPCDSEIVSGAESPLRKPLVRGEIKIGNRIAVHPMEGWDGTADGNPSEHTIRRWKRFGHSGGKLIWGGEAVAVLHEGRANPNQLLAAEHTRKGLAKLREVLPEDFAGRTLTASRSRASFIVIRSWIGDWG